MNKKILDQYVEEGWLVSQKHPKLPLEIYNYSQKTQYEKKWDSVTLACRGLIVDSETGNIVVKPFSKFFNYEEVSNEVPWETSEHVWVQEKMDGSLGILFNYKGDWILATRGSFTSVQAIKGMEIIKKKYDLSNFFNSIAYIVEIIFPQNRVVVSYDGEMVSFLGAVGNRSSETVDNFSDTDELNWQTAEMFFNSSGIRKEDVVNYDLKLIDKLEGDKFYESLKSLNSPNKEGFVLRFFPSNFRCKIKFEDYVALHRIVTQISSYDIWEALKNKGEIPESVLEKVPDEFYEWVKKTEKSLISEFRLLKSLHFAQFESIKNLGISERKEFASEFVKIKDHKINSGILFSILDGKKIDEKIWDLIKPKYEKPFGNIK